MWLIYTFYLYLYIFLLHDAFVYFKYAINYDGSYSTVYHMKP